jgi:hypothetical protein
MFGEMSVEDTTIRPRVREIYAKVTESSKWYDWRYCSEREGQLLVVEVPPAWIYCVIVVVKYVRYFA